LVLENANYWFDLGRQHCDARRWADAVHAFELARSLNPQDALGVSCLAVALLHLGRTVEAERWAREAIAIDGSQGSYWANLGACLYVQSRWAEAALTFREAASRDRSNAAIWSNLGEAEQRLGRLPEAQAAFEQSLAINPRQASSVLGLASVIGQQGRVEEGLALITTVLNQVPDYAPAWLAAGNMLSLQGKFQEAIDRLRRAAELAPDRYEVRYNLGKLLADTWELAGAENLARGLIRDFPNIADGWALQGKVQQQAIGRLAEAESSYRKALDLDPDHADAQGNLAILTLLLGKLDQGWRDYEWRFLRATFEARPGSGPRWDGQEVSGKTILVYAELGLGDTLQFIRYLPLLQQRGVEVIFECPEMLLPLFSMLPVDQLVTPRMPRPQSDYHCPIISLPRLLTSPIDFLAASVPYIRASSTLVEKWKIKLAAIEGMKIGIAWQGNPRYPFDRWRSIPLVHFAEIAKVPGISLVSLQKGSGTEQLANFPSSERIVQLGQELDSTAGTLMDTAAIMMNLDLVITSDTSIAHLAGALGVSVWVGLSFIPDWRWQLDRSDSPWYPTMRLFRQKQPGNWSGVFEEMQATLCELLPATH
jgi:Flp pilus assembly protein TadD